RYPRPGRRQTPVSDPPPAPPAAHTGPDRPDPPAGSDLRAEPVLLAPGVLQIGGRDLGGRTDRAHATAIEPEHPVAMPAHDVHAVAREHDRLAGVTEAVEDRARLLAKGCIADAEDLVEDLDLGIDEHGDGEA